MEENNLIEILIWIIGFIVALTVGSGMINKTLFIPIIPEIITIVFGWIVIVGIILSLVLAIFNK